MAAGDEDGLRSGGGHRRVWPDPRLYQTTVKEFVKDKNGKVAKAVLLSLEPKRMRRQADHDGNRWPGEKEATADRY